MQYYATVYRGSRYGYGRIIALYRISNQLYLYGYVHTHHTDHCLTVTPHTRTAESARTNSRLPQAQPARFCYAASDEDEGVRTSC